MARDKNAEVALLNRIAQVLAQAGAGANVIQLSELLFWYWLRMPGPGR